MLFDGMDIIYQFDCMCEILRDTVMIQGRFECPMRHLLTRCIAPVYLSAHYLFVTETK